MMGTAWLRDSARSLRAKDSPVASGSIQSRRISCGSVVFTSASAWRMVLARSTLYPAFCRLSVNTSWSSGLSSTTRIVLSMVSFLVVHKACYVWIIVGGPACSRSQAPNESHVGTLRAPVARRLQAKQGDATILGDASTPRL